MPASGKRICTLALCVFAFINHGWTRPLMTGVTIVNPFSGQPILRRPFDVTFTAVGAGGVTPYQFRWKVSGFLVRDWDPSPTFVWNGAGFATAGHTVTVEARGDGSSFVEATASIGVTILD